MNNSNQNVPEWANQLSFEQYAYLKEHLDHFFNDYGLKYTINDGELKTYFVSNKYTIFPLKILVSDCINARLINYPDIIWERLNRFRVFGLTGNLDYSYRMRFTSYTKSYYKMNNRRLF